ncbi:MAG: hypothetical protein QG656_2350 [Candidatus Hydrogenedentes bacterium]|nr:hypothetical protein [Candidatus Hydrogenedentota bacterium]
MKTFLVIGLVACLAGCGVEVLTTTAIQGELQAQQLKAMRGQVGAAADTSGKINLRRAIDTYYADKGYYPLTLDSLVPDFLPSVPTKSDGTKYGYSPSTGQLLDEPAGGAAPGVDGSVTPAAAGPSDEERIAKIREAMNRYGRAVGFYPVTLQSLVPQYLSEVPLTAAGQNFMYNNKDGSIWVPGQAPPPPVYNQQQAQQPVQQQRQAPAQNRPQGRAGVPMGGGSGPMGEVMTGISISNELDRGSNSGASAAGSYSRDKVGGATQQHNQQQQKALDQLGF